MDPRLRLAAPLALTVAAALFAAGAAAAAEPFRNVTALELKENANPAQDEARDLTRPGCALVGISLRYGTFVRALAPVFAPIGADGSLGAPAAGDFVGDARAEADSIALGKSGYVIAGLRIRAGWVVDSVSVIWRKWDASARAPTGPQVASKAYGGSGGDEYASIAPETSFAVGLKAYAASLQGETYLGGVGLIAGNFLKESGSAPAAAAAGQQALAFPPSQLDAPRWPSARYAIAISEQTYADPAWRKVADALQAKRSGKVFRYGSSLAELQKALSQYYPHYLCFVCRPQEAAPEFVESAHRFMRTLDADPYADAVWAILTGLDAQDALRVASDSGELVVNYGLGGMLNWLNRVPSGTAFWEGADGPGRQWTKEPGKALRESKKVRENHGYDLVEILGRNVVDGFWTSGHANRNVWKVFYPDGPAAFTSRNGELFADLDGATLPVRTDNPKIYLGAGNCLIGCIDGPDAMALAWIRSGGARQFFGYVVSTYYGFMGWGTGDYFFNTRGQFDFAESWYAANQCEMALLESGIAEGYDRTAMEFEIDDTALYGDPAWMAVVGQDAAVAQPMWTVSFEKKAGPGTAVAYAIRAEYRSTVGNGQPKDMRPFFTFLPQRLKNARVLRQSGPIRESIVSDNFAILILDGSSIPKGTVAEIVVEGLAAE